MLESRIPQTLRVFFLLIVWYAAATKILMYMYVYEEGATRRPERPVPVVVPQFTNAYM